MLSRRSFLKIAGLGTLALSTGYSIGSLISGKTDFISMYGFLPYDKSLISEVFNTFGNHINSGAINSCTVKGDSRLVPIIKSAMNKCSSGSFLGGVKVQINITKAGQLLTGDILLRNNHLVLSPEKDFNNTLNILRSRLKDTKAEFFFSADIYENNFIGGLLNKNKTLIIENEKGIFDEINLAGKTRDIVIPGNCGNMIITAGNEFAHVKKSSCRNKLCEHSGCISSSNPVISCAPNKIILRMA
ncbi:MAG: NusG domain II-containing protein [Ignavibacteria bacterium]|nr:NusG domain II-containing protein [Ignavibacteria bacterium]